MSFLSGSGHLPEIPFHTSLQKARGQVGGSGKDGTDWPQNTLLVAAGQGEMCQGKCATRILLDTSSYDEYSWGSGKLWEGTPVGAPQNRPWEGKMGRTVMPYSHVMESERERLKPFRRTLSKEDQQAFDRLFGRAKMHTSAGVYMANPWPMETILLSICLEHGKIIEEILGKFKEKKP